MDDSFDFSCASTPKPQRPSRGPLLFCLVGATCFLLSVAFVVAAKIYHSPPGNPFAEMPAPKLTRGDDRETTEMFRDLVALKLQFNRMLAFSTQSDFWGKMDVFFPPNSDGELTLYDDMQRKLHARYGHRLKKLKEIDAEVSDATFKLNDATVEKVRDICLKYDKPMLDECLQVIKATSRPLRGFPSNEERQVHHKWIAICQSECRAEVAKLERKILPARAFR